MPVEGDLAFRRRSETIVEWIDAHDGELTLDCGCGYGFTLRALTALTGGRFVGLDYQQIRLDEIQAKFNDLSRLDLIRGSAMQLPFADASFDHLVSSEVLEHLSDDRAAAREFFRVLKPGGNLVITVPSGNFPFTWDPPNWILKRLTLGRVQLKGERPWSGIWYGHQRLYSPDVLRRLLIDAGFEIVEERGLAQVTPPFAHLLLYGIGKPLLQSGILPKRLASQAGREESTPKPPRGVLRLVMRVLEAIDKPNDRAGGSRPEQPSVALAIRARRPA
jgi:ubiquinone/menaquinone biosynthesis C-methylase UbiE